MNLGVIMKTGKQSLPIIICTISTSLIIAWLLRRIINVPSNTAILVGVGSSICGGSAIAATAPVIDADDTEVAQAISVIFFFNVIAAVLFPVLGHVLGFDTTSGSSFGLFAGTAINDTSSVTAAASTWDSMWKLGNETLECFPYSFEKLWPIYYIVGVAVPLILVYGERWLIERTRIAINKKFLK